MERSNYSFSARLLHRLALGSTAVTRAAFDMEGAIGGAESVEEGRHIFIAGLARAGTTVLLRALHDTGRFRSLTYRDMPFVLMPRLWRRLSAANRRPASLQERAHGDNIAVGYDSPEAFEEVFWRTFCGRDYIFKQGLRPHQVDDRTLERFRQYIARIIASSPDTAQTRYLSKNNNNLLRLPAIARAFPQAVIAIPFRHPLQQAWSLQNQHQRFLRLHAEDNFARHYMNWLVHHEFGASHRPFLFEPGKQVTDSGIEQAGIDYWLSTWLSAYRYILTARPANATLVCYEDICKNSDRYLQQLLGKVGVVFEPTTAAGAFTEIRHAVPHAPGSALLAEAVALYQALREAQEI